MKWKRVQRDAGPFVVRLLEDSDACAEWQQHYVALQLNAARAIEAVFSSCFVAQQYRRFAVSVAVAPTLVESARPAVASAISASRDSSCRRGTYSPDGSPSFAPT